MSYKHAYSSVIRNWIHHISLLQEGGPLPGPETRLLCNTRKWTVWGDTCADKARDFIGKGQPGGEQQDKGTQENCSAAWLAVSGFMVMGLFSEWSLAHHSNSESFLVAHALLSYGQGGLACCGSWCRKESDTTERLNWTELNYVPGSVLGARRYSSIRKNTRPMRTCDRQQTIREALSNRW